MKELYNNIKNKAFDNQVRLSIMSMLMVNDAVDFSMFKEMLELSDGNLSSHLSFLENENYISVNKQFIKKIKITINIENDKMRKTKYRF